MQTPNDSDLAAREATITGQPQRIEPLKAEAFSEEARAMVYNMRKAFKATIDVPIPEYFGLMLRHPGLFRCQIDTSLQLVTKGAISRREQELAILRVGWLCRAPFEWGEHVDIAKLHGVSAAEIERVTQGSSAPGWSEHERAILRGVEELLGNQMLGDVTWNALAKSWNEAQLIEFPALVGQYFTSALLQNSLRVRLAADNTGLRHR
jgi:4-carboxymuconolactone decarboxylase